MSLRNRLAMLATTGVAIGILCLALLGPAALSAPPAQTASTTLVNDTGHLRFLSESDNGRTITEEGPATGTLPGIVRAQLTLSSTVVRSGFTIYLHGGSISGSGIAKLNVGRGEYSSFGGSLNISHGSGRYAHASGTGGLYGTINRSNDNAIVRVLGHLHY